MKAKVRETPTDRSLARLIDILNPIITGWRNYYRHATPSLNSGVGKALAAAG